MVRRLAAAILSASMLALFCASAPSASAISKNTGGKRETFVLSSKGATRRIYKNFQSEANKFPRYTKEHEKERQSDGYRAALAYAENPRSADVSYNPTSTYTGDECRKKHQYGGFDYKDRFSYCFVAWPQLEYESCDRTSCQVVGQETFRVTAIGIGTVGSQKLRTQISLDEFTPTGKTFPNQTMQVNFVCGYLQEKSKCKSNHYLGITQTISAWRSQSNTWKDWEFTFPKGATDWTQGVNWDKRDYQHFHETILGLDNPSSGQEIRYDAIPFRCDGAKYSKTGCIFDKATSVWYVDSKKYPAVAAHIKLAQDKPGTGSLPKSSGVVIPGGKKSSVPLTRNYWSTKKVYKAEGKRISKSLEYKNRSKSVAMCRALFSKPGHPYTQGPNGEKYDCDEYPFASTYQGSATTGHGTNLWYSVQALSATQNQLAGGDLGRWVTADHVLDRDPYWVEIK